MRAHRLLALAAAVVAVSAGCNSAPPKGYLLKPTGERVPLKVTALPAGMRAGHLWCERVRVPTPRGMRYTVALHMVDFLDSNSETRRFVLRHLDVEAGGRTYPGTVSLVGVGNENKLTAYEQTEEIDRGAGGALNGTMVPWSRVVTKSAAFSFLNDDASKGRADEMTLTTPTSPTRCTVRVVSGFNRSDEEVPLRVTS